MSTFAEWKKKSSHFKQFCFAHNESVIERALQSAYKAGERQGRKDAEEMARRAILLSAKLKK